MYDADVDFTDGRLAALILADEPPPTLAEQAQATVAQQLPGVQAQRRLLDEALTVLETGGHDEAARRLGDLRLVFALGPALYSRVVPAVLPGMGYPPAGAR